MSVQQETVKVKKSLILKYSGYLSGIAAGMADTLTNYPPYGLHYRVGRGTNIWQWKYWIPRELYRGVMAYSAIIPVTCIMDGVSQSLVSAGVNSNLASFSSGMLAALLVSTPTGNIIVTDQRLSESNKPAGLINSIKNIYTRRGVSGFLTGIQWIAAREGVYSWAVFSGKNDIKRRFDCDDFTASFIAGTFATAISQPMDTSATYLQNQVEGISLSEGVKRMWKEEGVKRFYRGVYFRWYAVIAGIFVMDKTSSIVKRHLSKYD